MPAATRFDIKTTRTDGHTRVDGPAKVCGTAIYSSDVRLPHMAYAVAVTSTVARGRIRHIDAAAALAVSGVLAVATQEDADMAGIRHVGHVLVGSWANSTLRPLASPHIHYAGQLVALIAADTPQAAQDAAGRLHITYDSEPPIATLAAATNAQPLATIRESHRDRRCGNVDQAMAQAAAVLEADYATPIQHHNPIELFSSTCVWQGDQLTVYEPSRSIGAVKHGLAAQLGLNPDQVRAVASLIGGHFGAKLALSQFTAPVALLARRLDRPLRFCATRAQTYTLANHRSESRHHMRLGADAAGHLLALSHSATTVSSRFDDFAMPGTDVSTAMYACANVAALEQVARVDRNTPGPMRAPPEVPYLFALESAIDELAHALNLDPIELRRRNDTLTDPVDGKPFTTRPLMRCFDRAAAAFGWSDRGAPGQRRDGDWRIGVGCASAARPAKIAPAMLRLRVTTDGHAHIASAHHEIGNGITTALTMAAAEQLRMPLENVHIALGDTDLPPAGISGGSSTTASLLGALVQAVDLLDAKKRAGETLPLQVQASFVPDGMDEGALDALRHGRVGLTSVAPGKLGWAFGAHMVEVAVHAITGEVRVRRHVGAFAPGRLVNPLTARSQLLGAMIWGMSSALLEQTEVDPRSGIYVNDDLAEYLLPVAADVAKIEVLIVDDDDPDLSSPGIKGLGELGLIGVNAAIANAVFNATGQRVRSLPIRLEHFI